MGKPKIQLTGEQIRKLRAHLGLNQTEFAKRLRSTPVVVYPGAVQEAVSMWESGKRVADEVTSQAVLTIAEREGVDLFEEDEE